MLDPKRDRLDYGKELNTPSKIEFGTPDEFELDAAIATTYSLDLDALLAVSVALGFKDTLEGDLSGEKLVLLEAISSLKGKLKVFYQKGKVNLPPEYNYLFTLLEPCLSPVVPSGGAFSSFHPKLWLLRFVESSKKRNREIRYRLIVLTRNLTFDRSWDLAMSIDGKVVKELQFENENRKWIDFFLELLKDEKTFLPKKSFTKELPYIEWEMIDGTRGLKLLPGSEKYQSPLDIKNIDSMMVLSPFIKDAGNQIKALDWLGSKVPKGGKKLLLSRAEELNAIGEEKLADWECYSINNDVVEGEERLEEGIKRHNLHAKLIVTQRGAVVDWHLGSANATSAALGDASNDPRNTEFMVKFSGKSSKIGPDILMQQWIGEENGRGLFVRHTFETLDDLEKSETNKQLRSLIFALIDAQWLLQGTIEPTGTYTLTLDVNSKNLFERIEDSGAQIEVDQLAIAGSKQLLTEQMQWHNVELTQISAFIPISIRLQAEEDIVEKVLIQVPLDLEGGDTRYQGILKKMLDSNEKVLNYIRMLLNPEADKNEWLAHERNNKNTINAEIDVFNTESPLFEQLMFTASRHPEALERLEILIKNLENSNVEIPKEFKVLWQHFRMGIKLNA
jgi:hypothetical protein